MEIEVNPYNIFYYYVPIGARTFEYSTGIVVTVPREEGATLEAVKKQHKASAEDDGSVFVSELNSWFIPVENYYFEISYPKGTSNCDKNILQVVRNKE